MRKHKGEKPRYTKRTVVIREEFAERLRRESFFSRREIKTILDEILSKWFSTHPEKPLPDGESVLPLGEQSAALEAEAIKQAMMVHGNNRQAAAAALGKSRVQLWRLCQKYGLKFPRGRSE